MVNIGAIYKCDICGNEEFLKQTKHHAHNGGWGCYSEYDTSNGWVHKSEIGDMCPECSNKLKEKLIVKYGFTEDHVKCYLNNFRDRYICDPHGDCPRIGKCKKIAQTEKHGTKYGG